MIQMSRKVDVETETPLIEQRIQTAIFILSMVGVVRRKQRGGWAILALDSKDCLLDTLEQIEHSQKSN